MDIEKNKPITEERSQVESTVFKEKDSKVGPLIGSIIVILIIIVGGIYFLSTQVEEIKDTNQGNQPEENVLSQPEDDPIEEADLIEAELENLNLEDLEAELDAIDSEFDSI